MHKFYAENPLLSTWYPYNSMYIKVFFKRQHLMMAVIKAETWLVKWVTIH